MRMPSWSAGMLFAVAVAVRAVDAQTAVTTITVSGTVRDSASGEVLPHALVSVAQTTLATRSNADGRFALLGVPTGRHIVRVQYVGYQVRTVAVDVRPGMPPLAVVMSRSTAVLEGVTVEAGRDQGVSVGERIGEISISPAQVARAPSLGEVDVFRTLQLLPGVSASSDGNAGLYVRGGTPDQNLVLLDGMTVYHVDHFFGMFSAFNADALKDVRLFAGGYPAKHGGRASSVLELTGKSGDDKRVRVAGGLNLLSARSVLEVPLGKGSLLLAGRRSYTDLIRSPLYNRLFDFRTGSTSSSAPRPPAGGPGGAGRLQQESTQPDFHFYDLNGKLTYRPSRRDVASISYYAGKDLLDQGQESNPPAGGPGGPGGPPAGGSTTDVSDWGNVGASARWFRQWATRFSSDALIATSTYGSTGRRESTFASGGPNVGSPSFREENRVEDMTVRLDTELHVAAPLTLSAGAWLSRTNATYDYRLSFGQDSSQRTLTRDATASLVAGYGELQWRLGGWATLTAGARYNAYDLTSDRFTEPRLAAVVRPFGGWQLKAAWGLYHQFVNRVENEDVLRGSRDFWLLADSATPPTAAEHRLVGASYEGRGYLLSIEAYDKALDDVSLFSTRFRRGPLDAGQVVAHVGEGTARGIDMLAQRTMGAFTGWVSYSLSEATYRFPTIDSGREFPGSQDQRHQLKNVGSYARGPWTASATWVFASGRAYTSPESQYQIRLLDGTTSGYIHIGDKNAARLPDYHRLDLALFRKFRTNGPIDFEVGASVFNAYNRSNVWYRKFDLSTSPVTVTDVRMLGLTPSLELRFTTK
jgi:ferric enterobactin receptor